MLRRLRTLKRRGKFGRRRVENLADNLRTHYFSSHMIPGSGHKALLHLELYAASGTGQKRENLGLPKLRNKPTSYR